MVGAKSSDRFVRPVPSTPPPGITLEIDGAEGTGALISERIDRDQPARQRERVAERRQHLLPNRDALALEQAAKRFHQLGPSVDPAGGVIDDLQGLGQQPHGALEVAGSQCRGAGQFVLRRGVGAHAAANGRRRRAARELVEARQRLGLAVGLPELDVRPASVRAEDRHDEKRVLERPAAVASGAHVRRTQQHGVGGEGEHVVEAPDEARGEIVVQGKWVTNSSALRASQCRLRWSIQSNSARAPAMIRVGLRKGDGAPRRRAVRAGPPAAARRSARTSGRRRRGWSAAKISDRFVRLCRRPPSGSGSRNRRRRRNRRLVSIESNEINWRDNARGSRRRQHLLPDRDARPVVN